MSSEKLKDRYKGVKFTVIHCDGALESYMEALDSVDARKRKSFTRGVMQQIERLAGGHRMSKENFPQEGALPKRKGQQKAKKFNALKRIPIRGIAGYLRSIKIRILSVIMYIKIMMI